MWVLILGELADNRVTACRRWLIAGLALESLFCVVKVVEYGFKMDQGLTPATNTFFTYYYMLTGFHFNDSGRICRLHAEPTRYYRLNHSGT